ncbi:MAG: TonB-dependent receptor [Tannerellaceae bacterium]|jgi:TonB-linked SusC/RagA family outer membrane protein|nr:TonB-dependent receptor [Tannerellaceae bacterium]
MMKEKQKTSHLAKIPMLRTGMISLLFMAISSLAMAQTLHLSGTVLDETGAGAAGVNILIKGTTEGTVTDLDGNFRLQASEGDILLISSLGYKKQEVRVTKAADKLLIRLEEDTELLEEVVVVGYGTQKRKDVIGSVESVNTTELQKVKSSNVMNALQGMVAGVNIQNADGAPGSTPNVMIRGLGTMGSHAPLYIIDGAPGDISYLDPDDIASLSVLKDGSAAAIYGSRAANGVILITTKRGKDGPPRVEFGVDYGLKYVDGFYEMLNARQYADFAAYLHEDAGNPVPEWIKNYATYSDTDWLGEMTRIAPSQKYRVSVGGGSQYVTYDISGSFMKDEGVMIESHEQRPSLRSRIDFKKDKVNAGLQMGYIQKAGKSLRYTGESVLTDIIRITPLGSVYDETGDYSLYLGDNRELRTAHYTNPVFNAKHPDKKYENSLTSLNAYIDYTLIKGLLLRGQGTLDNYSDWDYSFIPKYNYGGTDVQAESKLDESRTQSRNWQVTTTLNYNAGLGKHHIDALAGYEARKRESRVLGGRGEGFASDAIRVPEGASQSESIYGTALATSYLSMFGRLNYHFDNRYYFSGTIRRDGSSRFSKDNKWGNFPSLALAWRVSNEAFFEPLKGWFSDLKLRASYGQLGNDQIGDYMFQSLLSNSNLYYLYGGAAIPVSGWTVTDIASKNIKWETSVTRNIGLDLGFLDNSLTVFIEYFNNQTNDLLVNKYIPHSNGVNPGIMSNYGKISNQGLEISAMYKAYKRAFKWDIAGNVSFLKNKVLRMGAPDDFIEGGQINYTAYFTRVQEGEAVGSYYVYKAGGLFQNQSEIDAYVNAAGEKLQPNAQPGDLRFIDLNGDGLLDDKDRFFAGSPFPEAEFSVVFNGQYRNFDLMLSLGGALGFELINGLQYKYESGVNPLDNKSVTVLDRWTPQHTDTQVPRIGANDDNNNRRASTRYMESGDYVRIRLIQIGYTLPKHWIKGGNWRFYVNLNNPFTLTAYKGPNPEVGGNDGYFNRGVDMGNYPLYKTLMFGTSFSF